MCFDSMAGGEVIIKQTCFQITTDAVTSILLRPPIAFPCWQTARTQKLHMDRLGRYAEESDAVRCSKVVEGSRLSLLLTHPLHVC